MWKQNTFHVALPPQTFFTPHIYPHPQLAPCSVILYISPSHHLILLSYFPSQWWSEYLFGEHYPIWLPYYPVSSVLHCSTHIISQLLSPCERLLYDSVFFSDFFQWIVQHSYSITHCIPSMCNIPFIVPVVTLAPCMVIFSPENHELSVNLFFRNVFSSWADLHSHFPFMSLKTWILRILHPFCHLKFHLLII